VPEVHFNWLHELNNPTLTNTASFAGLLPFSTPGFKTANDTLNAGVGFTFLSCACTAKTWSVEAVYDYDLKTPLINTQRHYTSPKVRENNGCCSSSRVNASISGRNQRSGIVGIRS
jgi:hypothetical protein